MVVTRALQKLTEPELVQLATDSGFQVKAMAEMIGCSDTSLRRHFEKIIGVLPCKWMQYIRLKKGLILVTGDKSVKEAAGLTGFKYSNFIRCFRETFNVTPGQAALGAEIHIELAKPPTQAPQAPQPKIRKQKPQRKPARLRSNRNAGKRHFAKKERTN